MISLSLNQTKYVIITAVGLALLLTPACYQSPAAEQSGLTNFHQSNNTMNDIPLPPSHNETSSSIATKRLPPPEIKPIILDDIQYQVVTSKSEDHLTAITSLSATQANGEVLWHKEIYTIVFTPELETDAQEVYVSSMQLNDNKDAIIIENEQGQTFTIDIE